MMTRLEIVASEEEAPIPVLPDCANPGIALRVFLLIQAMLLCVAWSASDHLDELVAEWTAQQFAVLPAMLIGLPLMSLTRRRALLWPEWILDFKNVSFEMQRVVSPNREPDQLF